MGFRFVDQYSLLHFATGVVAYFWGISFELWSMMHLIFELSENTFYGMVFINKYFTLWPGGKPQRDGNSNIFGDQTFAMIGWYIAHLIDEYGKKNGLYFPK